MTEPTAESAIVAEHFHFLDEIGRRLRDDPYRVGAITTAPLIARFPGLQPLLDSLVSASPTPRKVLDRTLEDWNPLSQRVLLSDERLPDASLFEQDFTRITHCVQSFVEWGHEAVHILAMEPWLCGRRAITTQDAFRTWYLASEAFAFWYADIVITRAVRSAVPDADLVYTRRAVSNAGFHPEAAFQRIGLTTDAALLPVYIDAFLGRDTGLDASDHPYPRTFAMRLRKFYSGAGSTLDNLHTTLADFGLLTDYYARFCAIDGLPALFDDDVMTSVADCAIDRYHVRLGLELLPQLQQLAPERVARVAARRHVQTRAYYAWFMRQTLVRDWVLAAAGFDPDALAHALATYLDGLCDALHGLAGGATPDHVLARLTALDAAYDVDVRAPLLACDAHVKYRYRLYPFFAASGGVVGLCDGRSALSSDEMLAVVQFVMKRCAWDGPRGDAGIVARLHSFLTTRDVGDAADVRAAYNEFMTHPLALAVWSVPLGELQPSHNHFREFAFEYT